MADNLYLQDEATGGSLLGDIALPLGTAFGHQWTTTALIGRAARKRIGQTHWWGPERGEARRRANRASRQIWQGSRGKGWDLGARLAGAYDAAEAHLPGKRIRGRGTAFRAAAAGHRGGAAVAQKITGIVERTATKRMVAGLLRAPLGVANAYFMLGSALPAIAEGIMGGLSEMQRFGAKLRQTTPETSVGWQDTATRERAFTMRQASLMAMHMSQSGTRAALGEEASFLHS